MSVRTMYTLAALMFATQGVAGSPPFGTTWFLGHDRYSFKQDDQLIKWEPKHPEVILTHIPAQKLKEPGDKVLLKFRWMSDGRNDCPAKYFSKGAFCETKFPCAHRSVRCLAGTGDFRIGLFDSKTDDADQITKNGFADADRYGNMNKQLAGKPFNKYRGYHFRLYPHISPKSHKYIDVKTGGHVPCGFYIKDDDGLFSSHRVSDAHGCFDLPTGHWGTLKLFLKKLKKDTIELGWEMNGYSYYTEHKFNKHEYMDKYMPHQVDTVAIMYPNGRRYYYVEFASADFDGSDESHFVKADNHVHLGLHDDGGVVAKRYNEHGDEVEEGEEATNTTGAEEAGEEEAQVSAVGAESISPEAVAAAEAVEDVTKEQVADPSEKARAAADNGEDEIDRLALKAAYKKEVADMSNPVMVFQDISGVDLNQYDPLVVAVVMGLLIVFCGVLPVVTLSCLLWPHCFPVPSSSRPASRREPREPLALKSKEEPYWSGGSRSQTFDERTKELKATQERLKNVSERSRKIYASVAGVGSPSK